MSKSWRRREQDTTVKLSELRVIATVLSWRLTRRSAWSPIITKFSQNPGISLNKKTTTTTSIYSLSPRVPLEIKDAHKKGWVCLICLTFSSNHFGDCLFACFFIRMFQVWNEDSRWEPKVCYKENIFGANSLDIWRMNKNEHEEEEKGPIFQKSDGWWALRALR